jgi:hypothetical protein
MHVWALTGPVSDLSTENGDLVPVRGQENANIFLKAKCWSRKLPAAQPQRPKKNPRKTKKKSQTKPTYQTHIAIGSIPASVRRCPVANKNSVAGLLCIWQAASPVASPRARLLPVPWCASSSHTCTPRRLQEKLIRLLLYGKFPGRILYTGRAGSLLPTCTAITPA